MAELKCPCGLRDDMTEEECDAMDCDKCCPLAIVNGGADNALDRCGCNQK